MFCIEFRDHKLMNMKAEEVCTVHENDHKKNKKKNNNICSRK